MRSLLSGKYVAELARALFDKRSDGSAGADEQGGGRDRPFAAKANGKGAPGTGHGFNPMACEPV